MYDYKIVAHEENGHYWSSCPDVPEAHSVGDTLDDLLKNAVEGITLALSIYVDQKRPIPPASSAGEHNVPLPSVTVSKIVLWNELLAKGKTKADLANILGISPTAAGRLVDFEHNSKIEQIEQALKMLGRRILVQPIDPFAVAIQFYPSFNPQGHRTILVKLPHIPMDALPQELMKAYENVQPQESVVNLNDLASRWWLTAQDAENLKTKGWSAFSFAPIKH